MSDDKACRVKRWDLLKAQLQNLKPAQVVAFLDQHPECTIIDCRRADEFLLIRFPSAINIDYLSHDFWARIEQLSPDHFYLVYCNTCRRSTRTCTLMKNGGFKQVYNLDGGLRDWVDQLGDDALIRAMN